jgi:hypothetical protein
VIFTESSVVVSPDPDRGDVEASSEGFEEAADDDGIDAGTSEADATESPETTAYRRQVAAVMSRSTAMVQLRLRNQTDRRPELRPITKGDFSGHASALKLAVAGRSFASCSSTSDAD